MRASLKFSGQVKDHLGVCVLWLLTGYCTIDNIVHKTQEQRVLCNFKCHYYAVFFPVCSPSRKVLNQTPVKLLLARRGTFTSACSAFQSMTAEKEKEKTQKAAILSQVLFSEITTLFHLLRLHLQLLVLLLETFFIVSRISRSQNTPQIKPDP